MAGVSLRRTVLWSLVNPKVFTVTRCFGGLPMGLLIKVISSIMLFTFPPVS